MNRRQFLGALSAALAVPGIRPSARNPRDARVTRTKHWAWMRAAGSLDDWRRQLARMRAAGIDAVLIAGDADFYRRHVAAARDEGVELHAWIFTMMRGEQVKTHADWYAVSRDGISTADRAPYVDYYRFLCPSRDEVREYLTGVVRELAAIDGLASIHLDYIRYPDVILPVALWPKYKLVQDKEYPRFDFCYCPVCRARFQRRSGIDPQRIPDPPGDAAWRQYRYDSITEVVGLLADAARAHGTPTTAAVFPTPAIARSLVRQDWTNWKVDAVLPMIYHSFYKEDVPWIERATREGVGGLRDRIPRIPLYSGLYVPDLSPADLARAARYALAGGANGVCLFQGNTLTPEHWNALSPILTSFASSAQREP